MAVFLDYWVMQIDQSLPEGEHSKHLDFLPQGMGRRSNLTRMADKRKKSFSIGPLQFIFTWKCHLHWIRKKKQSKEQFLAQKWSPNNDNSISHHILGSIMSSRMANSSHICPQHLYLHDQSTPLNQPRIDHWWGVSTISEMYRCNWICVYLWREHKRISKISGP